MAPPPTARKRTKTAPAAVSERDLPLEERLRQKKNGFALFPNGVTAAASQARATHGSEDGNDDEDAGANSSANTGGGAKPKRNKNRPLELSSRRQVSRFKNVVEVKKKKLVDPRFDATTGRLNEDLFAKSYAFLDEYKQSELQELKKQLRNANSVTRKEELKHEINVRSQELSEKKKSEKIKSALTKRKRDERDAVASGKNPFYLKRKDKKKLELETKFQDLQESGRLSKFMAKKRKKNASKDHRWLPTQRKT
ncbi:hypothetical protein PybrP1_005338 [[Pythium] brassicae (nom. inval.)]|nr:hypothetical protein PybrP1_005338 [[Pythium] brassicae (nom. inval.)]